MLEKYVVADGEPKADLKEVLENDNIKVVMALVNDDIPTYQMEELESVLSTDNIFYEELSSSIVAKIFFEEKETKNKPDLDIKEIHIKLNDNTDIFIGKKTISFGQSHESVMLDRKDLEKIIDVLEFWKGIKWTV